MYDPSKLQTARTVPNVPPTPSPNGYNQQLDTIETIKSPGYFPANFSFAPGIVLVNDDVVAIGSDGINFGTVTAVSPTVTIHWLF